ncbi:MAG: YggS family pyridoxal phosphate-dependent enzyme [Thermodesulfobacteriota bacterium]
MSTIAENIERVRNNITDAARSSGRHPDEIRLVAVSKRFTTDKILEALGAGQTLFGENYIQEAVEKREQLPAEAAIHFIGHLQSNKCKVAATLFSMIETVDRLKLARGLQRQLEARGTTMDILIQVNIGEDPNKSGVLPDNAEELISGVLPLDRLNIRGLMTIPPICRDEDEARVYFRKLRILGETLRQRTNFCGNMAMELSMGMSGDYRAAIEEGATLVRVGTAIFGRRPV